MILGIGNDVIECDRIQKAIGRQGVPFAKRILGNHEFTAYEGFPRSRAVEYLAGRFAAKEAIAKALGCGLSRVAMNKLNIELGERGLVARWIQDQPEVIEPHDVLHISISHVRELAFATALWERRSHIG